MTAQDLTDVVFESPKFRNIMRSIRIEFIHVEFPMLDMETEAAHIDWNYALLCASALTSDPSERAQEAVLRLVVGCLMSVNSTDEHKGGAVALLERTGNRRTVKLAEERLNIAADAWTSMPARIRLEIVRRQIELTLPISTGENFSVNTFQSDLWSQAAAHSWLSVSAPTSAGKSRIVRELFLERTRQSDAFTAVYIVPTRALVDEVSSAFRRTRPADANVFVMPWDPTIITSTKRILVLTQERLHLLQQQFNPFKIDLLFIDEAQHLGEANRGVLLQQVLDRTVADNTEVQVIFASPLSDNPEILLEGAPHEGDAHAINSGAVTVNQNLLRVESVYRAPSRRTVSLVHNGVPERVASFELANRPARIPMRLAYVAHALGGALGGNIVYVNGQSEAESVAKNIYESIGPHGHYADVDIINLQELIKSAIHPKYALVDTLARKVAFHYGNMPLAIRTEIERLFEAGKIDYLVCTSTLLEGVNLPCRNIFVRNPQKGRGKPLTHAEFWNLAGRAGRWGREFQGNIICVDTDDPDAWPNLPLVRGKSKLQRTVKVGLQTPDSLLEFIRNGSPVQAGQSPAENLFSYLCSRYVMGANFDIDLAAVNAPEARKEIADTIRTTVDDVSYPISLISKHAGISPAAMQRLLEYFRVGGHDPEHYVLPLPEESDAKSRYQEAFLALGRTATDAFGAKTPPRGSPAIDKRKWQLANLVVNWMNGMPLRNLIEQRSTPKIPLAKAIRDVMTDVENIARFQAPKYLSCYSDVLAVYASEKGFHDFAPSQDITMLLELGVSRQSEVVLISLGLSRTTTIAIGAFVASDFWSTNECIEWLRTQNLAGLDLPVLVQKEIADLLAIWEKG